MAAPVFSTLPAPLMVLEYCHDAQSVVFLARS